MLRRHDLTEAAAVSLTAFALTADVTSSDELIKIVKGVLPG